MARILEGTWWEVHSIASSLDYKSREKLVFTKIASKSLKLKEVKMLSSVLKS